MSNYISTRGRGKGQWWPAQLADKLSAIFYCPECGQAMDLRNHTIDNEGGVHPSVVEPIDRYPACPNPRCGTFHRFITLSDWSIQTNPAPKG